MKKTSIAAVVCAGLMAVAAAYAGEASPAAIPARAANWSTFDSLIADVKKTMMADPNAALAKARSADAFARVQPASPRRSEALATSLWLEGEALTRINRIDEARTVLDRASALAANNGRLTRLDGDLALSHARLADATGDVAGALRNYHRAYDIFSRLGIPRYQSIALQGLGSIYDKAHDFNREIEYYRKASQVYSADPALELSAANNIGFGLQQLGRYDDAIAHFEHALKIAGTLNSPFLQANILTNVAVAYAKAHRFAAAERAANRALKLINGQKGSGLEPFVWGVKAEIEFERGALSAAVADIDRAFRGIELKKTVSSFRDMHEIAYKIYSAAANYPLALAHLEAFKRLDDEGLALTASANLALLAAQFDFANQQLEIEHLKSEQLKRDIRLHESEAATQRAIFSAALLAGILIILWFGWRHMTLRRHRNELTRTLRERNLEIERRIEVEAQLRVAMETAEQANRAKSHFLANMSHELRTPLNAIIGFSNLMVSGKLSTPKTQEYASDIHASGRKLLVILNDILDMARIDAGDVVLSDDEFCLADLVERTTAAAELEFPQHGKTIRIDGANRTLRVRADEARLKQVIGHLLSNALKFTAPDGWIDIAIERVADGADIVVRDNGIGIPREKLALVLEPFGQMENVYARMHGGIGLGLPIVKSLAELHGGRFMLVSEPGKGTTARVHLPLSRVVGAPGALARAS